MAEKKNKRYGVWIVVGLLFVGLLSFGNGGFGGNVRSLGSVGDKDLPVFVYQNALNRAIRATEAEVGRAVTFAEAQARGLDQGALNQVITERALDNEVAQLGISIGDERVLEQLLAVQGFQGLDGQFDRETYASALRRIGQTERQFEDGIRDELSRTLLQTAVVAGVAPPDAYANTVVAYLGSERDITYALLTAEALDSELPAPTEDALRSYHTEFSDDFIKPEARELSYAWLTPAMIQDEITVDETALRELYDTRIAEFVRPERRLVERLVYLDADRADAAMAQLEVAGQTFEGLVDARGLDLSDIDLGDVSQEELGAAGEAVFAASPGDVVGPFESDLGPALFRMNAILAAQTVTFEEAEADLREELAAARARRVIADSAEGITDLLAGGATIDDLAARTDMEAGQITWTPDTRDGIAAYDRFRAAAATVEKDAFLELQSLSDGGIFVVQLDAVIPPEVAPFEEVSEDVRAAFNARALSEALLAQAEVAAADISPLTDLAELGLTPIEVTNLTRRSFLEVGPADVITTIFEMNLGDVVTLGTGDGALILRLDDARTPSGDDPRFAADLEVVSQSAMAAITQDLFDIYAAEVRTNTDIRVDQSLINALHAQFQ